MFSKYINNFTFKKQFGNNLITLDKSLTLGIQNIFNYHY
ncbi:hypothetical protein HJ01_00892 [Flavobacterium frigoris PS1]|uniref:Uncharacterized protein n=1 Tax=Flavobacterium frigoris (strain PS1) TaxID=1086011 RepID=H7FNZ4_FLAFP|nr:hypothetical protein HJ01_00892 [Flavobacterium frigoris PS1]